MCCLDGYARVAVRTHKRMSIRAIIPENRHISLQSPHRQCNGLPVKMHTHASALI
jgi:hypothetical protein